MIIKSKSCCHDLIEGIIGKSKGPVFGSLGKTEYAIVKIHSIGQVKEYLTWEQKKKSQLVFPVLPSVCSTLACHILSSVAKDLTLHSTLIPDIHSFWAKSPDCSEASWEASNSLFLLFLG